MSLQFILGGSGSGKTRFLYENLIRRSEESPDFHYIAIVPEQFTMQTQKELVLLHPAHGVMNIDIVSFGRLAYRVFEELAIVNPPVLDDMGKSMVLRKAAAKQKKKLGLYKNHLDQNGFIGQLKSMLSELYQYGIAPDTLEKEVSLAQSPILRRKLEDITVIYKGFQEYISERYITTEEILDVLCHCLPESELVKNSVITLDGFTGFTPVQYRLIGLFLRYAKEVDVTVTIDPAEAARRDMGRQELFYMSRQMIVAVAEQAARNDISRKEDICLDSHPAVRYCCGQGNPCGDLDYLEQNLYRYKNHSYTEAPSSIHLYPCANPSEEIQGVARSIGEAVRLGNVRYRDVAVITGDLPSYSNEIIHQFELAGIPFFLDDKKSILKNPMVEYVRAALEILSRDFSYESVFRYLRTGLVLGDEDTRELDRLENYVLAMGIRGFKRWNETWNGWYKSGRDLNLDELNDLRRRIMEPLSAFRETFKKEGADVRGRTGAVAGLLSQCHIEEKMKALEQEFTAMGEFALAKEYGQVYGLVMDLFDRLVGLLGDEAIGQREYGEVLDAGFSEIKVGMIPATVDRVVVGDITRTRLDHIKRLYFVGVNDGIVPVKKENTSLFTDRERELLGSHSIELAPTSKEEGFRQRFYLYLALTKPEQDLFLSWCAVDSSGKSLRPSTLVGEMKKMFPKLEEQAWQQDGVTVPYTPYEAKQELARGLRAYRQSRDDGRFLELFRRLEGLKDYKAETEMLVDAAFYSYEKRGIGKLAAKALYGPVLSGSVTRLEQYASCAYAHFLSYGLELAERQRYELAAMDIGNLFHDSIDLCFQTMKDEGGDWKELTEEKRKALVHDCVGKVTEEYGNTILKSSARNAYLALKVERMTDRTMWALTEHLKKGDFTPAGFELSFSAQDDLKAMKIPLSEEESLHLRGRIDRMDLYEDDSHVYVKIIDYKSGSTSFDLSALYYGLQLQLVVYMDAALEMEERKNPGKSAVPAGIFYYNINDPVIDRESGMSREEIDGKILRSLRMNGLVNSRLEVISHLDKEIETESDVIPVAMKNGLIQEAKSSVAGEERFAALKTFVKEKLRTEGQEILDGAVDVNPYKQGNRTACDYCPYHAVCGFDLKTDGYGFRRFKAMKSDEIWPEIEGTKGGEAYGGELD